MSVINTNYLALVSQNNLTKSQNALGTAIERLSSGLRINSAKDDAAGQAIANRFTANIKGLTQASRNANDGISIAQTTEGALNEINNNLQRIRELTVQAANGSNSAEDRASIQNEIDQRMEEIDRVSRETQFNGKYVLGKDGGNLTIQVGAHDNQQITIELEEINQNTLKLDGFNVTAAYATSGLTEVTGVEAADAINISGTDNIDLSSLAADSTLTNVGKDENGDWFANVSVGGTTPTYFAINVGTDGVVEAITLDSGDGDTNVPTDYTATTEYAAAVPAVDYNITAVDPTAELGADAVVDGIFRNEDGDLFIKVTGAEDPAKNGYYAVDADEITNGVFSADAVDFSGNPVATEATGVNVNPLSALDNALQQVDNLRSHLGAIQNRFESTIANLNNTVNNLSAARSRIEDADYAVEVSNMTRAQILQQAGTSVLAQANQVPQTVLSLLR